MPVRLHLLHLLPTELVPDPPPPGQLAVHRCKTLSRVARHRVVHRRRQPVGLFRRPPARHVRSAAVQSHHLPAVAAPHLLQVLVVPVAPVPAPRVVLVVVLVAPVPVLVQHLVVLPVQVHPDHVPVTPRRVPAVVRSHVNPFPAPVCRALVPVAAPVVRAVLVAVVAAVPVHNNGKADRSVVRRSKSSSRAA